MKSSRRYLHYLSINYDMKPQNRNTEKLIILSAVLVGSVLRIIHVLNIDFPLNDGGLFLTLSQDLIENQFRLPFFTSYNNEQIPFAYPPLAFYFTAILSSLTNIELIHFHHYLPAIVSILTIPAFYLLSKAFIPCRKIQYYALFIFAILPTSYDWLIVGGGLTRSLGFLFSIIALTYLIRSLKQNKYHLLFTTSIFASLVVLSHPGVSWFTSYSFVIFFFIHLRENPRKVLKNGLVILASTTILISPWFYTVIQNHGLLTFTYPFQTESITFLPFLVPFSLLFTNEKLVAVIAFSGFIGVTALAYRKKWTIPIWLLSVFIFEPRLSPSYSVIPFSLASGTGIYEITHRMFLRYRKWDKSHYQRVATIFISFILLYTTVSSYLSVDYESLSTDQAEAMNWVDKNTPLSAEFIVLSGNLHYGTDYISEWFPTISKRRSSVTPQGYEWFVPPTFNSRAQYHKELQMCYFSNLQCLSDWSTKTNIGGEYIFLNKYAANGSDRLTIIGELKDATLYRPLYENNSIAIYKYAGEK